ncbi:hypothetical protein GQ457_11G006090 [Hibiscus cannabinus]
MIVSSNVWQCTLEIAIYTLHQLRTTNLNGEYVDISRGSNILKQRLLDHFREAHSVFLEIQTDRSEENIKNVWLVSLHVKKDIDR